MTVLYNSWDVPYFSPDDAMLDNVIVPLINTVFAHVNDRLMMFYCPVDALMDV